MTVKKVIEDLHQLLSDNYHIGTFMKVHKDVLEVSAFWQVHPIEDRTKVLARMEDNDDDDGDKVQVTIFHQDDWQLSRFVEMIRGLCTSHRVNYVMEFD